MVATDLSTNLVTLAKQRTPSDLGEGRIEFLVSDMLDLSRLASGKFPLQPTIVPVDELVTAASQAVERLRGLRDFVRFVDTKEAAKDEPNFFTKLFGAKDPTAKALNRYRIQVKADGANTLVSVLNYSGEPDNSASAQKIVSLLVEELKL